MSKSLKENLIDFLKSTKTKRIFISTLKDIRPLYRAHQPFGSLIGHIFNSGWNRKPKFDSPIVIQSKLGYVFRLGSGLASINQVPISLLCDTGNLIENFLLKDRGHILEITCKLYDSPNWSVIDLIKVIDTEIKELVENTQHQSSDRKNALSILNSIKEFINLKHGEFLTNGITEKADMKISIRDIADAVPEFEKNLNDTELSVEVKRESVATHIKEILWLNNHNNKWSETQLAWLSFWAHCFEKDNNSDYIDTVLKYDNLIALLDNIPAFNGELNSDNQYPLISNCIAKHCSKLTEGSIIIPIRLIAADRGIAEFSEIAKVLEKEKQSTFETLYKYLHTNKVSKDEFLNYIELYEKIINQSAWANFDKKVKSFYKANYNKKNTVVDTTNLVHTNILHSSYGGLALIACARIINETCNNRTSDSQIKKVVDDFCSRLYNKVEEVCNDGTYFSASSKSSMRVTLTILPVFVEMMKGAESKDKTLSKQKIYEILLNEIKGYLDGQVKFKVVKLTTSGYNGIPEVTAIDFSEYERSKAGFDLGQKEQTMGYSLDNCIVQQKHHNRSAHNVDHNINNVDYWKWYAGVNLQIVTQHKQYFYDNDMPEVVSDAKKLNERFN
jgi:hypothetical protein